MTQDELEQMMNDAINGNEWAQCKLALCYQNGDSVEQDTEKAIYWYTKAAEQDNEVAQCSLGIIYLPDEMDETWEKGIAWLTQSAQQGFVLAMYTLGLEYYYRGQTEEKFDGQAVYWLSKAAELGDANAQRWLGQCFLNGRGVEENHQEAVKWYTLAAEQDNGEAQYLLSICYERGIGVEANDSLSFYWCHKAAKQGLLDAQFALAARYYDQAKGVEYNMKKVQNN